jgi:hypothetical protein
MNNYEWVTKANIETDDGEGWVLEYYIYNQNNAYGLRVEKHDGGRHVTETETTPPFADSREDALRLAQIFAKGSVPPCTLLEMVDEWAFQCV